MTPPILLAVPNVSEGRDRATIGAIGSAFAGEPPASTRGGGDQSVVSAPRGARLLDVHSDRDHHRSVYTLAAVPGRLADAMLAGAAVAVERIDVMARRADDRAEAGEHPFVGVLDVAPIVYLDSAARGAACAEALVVADRVGEELEVPVFMYGELTASAGGPARAQS